MSKFRNFKMVDYVVYGRGSFDQLDEILMPNRKGDAPMIFLVDHFFEGKTLADRVPLQGRDKIIFADVTYEPKTTYVDKIANDLKEEFGTVSGVIGIGGGSTMDLAKAVSLNDDKSRFFSRLPGLGPCKVSRRVQGRYSYTKRNRFRSLQNYRFNRPYSKAWHE